MPESRKLLTVLFVDISNSSRLYREQGDEEASKIIRALLLRLDGLVQEHRGQVRDRIGDELMCTFGEAIDALRCASEMHKSMFRLERAAPDGQSLAVRIGLHCGEVIENDDGIFGDTVYTAKRLTELAKPYQALFCRETLDQIGQQEVCDYRYLGTAPLKGLSKSVPLYELVSDEIASTVALSGQPVAASAREPVLELTTPTTSLILKLGDRVTLGRSEVCELIIHASGVSKVHARIEGKHGFVLTDASTNGTYVVSQNSGQPRFLRRDELRLDGQGLIGLAQKPDSDQPHTLAYRLTTGEPPPCNPDCNSSPP